MHEFIIDYPKAMGYLKRRGKSQHEIARELGADQATVHRLAKGKTQDTTGRMALKLIQVLGGQITLPDLDS
jgi:plasmid maintenance system antidote protein VapI